MLMIAIERGVAREDQNRGLTLLPFIGVLAITIMMARGYYWNIFGRGHGFWTANRTSALAIFIALLMLPEIGALVQSLRRHRP